MRKGKKASHELSRITPFEFVKSVIIRGMLLLFAPIKSFLPFDSSLLPIFAYEM